MNYKEIKSATTTNTELVIKLIDGSTVNLHGCALDELLEAYPEVVSKIDGPVSEYVATRAIIAHPETVLKMNVSEMIRQLAVSMKPMLILEMDNPSLGTMKAAFRNNPYLIAHVRNIPADREIAHIAKIHGVDYRPVKAPKVAAEPRMSLMDRILNVFSFNKGVFL
jgi:hypothetical protein